MNTLVLKCKEVVNNPNLRTLEEIRVGLIAYGDGLKPTGWEGLSNTIPAKYKVIDGDAYFKLGIGSTYQEYKEIETTQRVFMYCPSGESTIAIKNFDSVGTELNYEKNDSENSPFVKLNIEELIGKDFIISVGKNVFQAEGNLAGIGVFPNMTRFRIGYDTFDSNCIYSLEDLKAFPNAEILVIRCLCTGGDVYKTLLGMNVCNISVARSNYNTIEHEQKQLTCSYTEGGELPTLEFKKFSSFQNNGGSAFDTAGLKAFFQLLKDGIDANKITVLQDASISLTVTTSVWNDSEVVSLRTYLESEGITCTRV